MVVPLVIAIDGPAGAGKSSITQALAQLLGFSQIDTGAMYRGITYYFLQIFGSDLSSDLTNQTVTDLLANFDFNFAVKDDKYAYFVNGEDVSLEIRSPEVTKNVSLVSSLPQVREYAVQLQKKLTQQAVNTGAGVVIEGRDIGTTVLPDADIKIFLTASIVERARRRALETNTTVESQIPLIAERDYLDETREFSPLRKAPDALEVDTSNDDFQTVISRLRAIVENHLIAKKV